MAILTEQQLRNQARDTTFSSVRLSASNPGATLFLSHSHLDRDIAKGLIGLLGSQGVSVYVDWNDSDMPRITSGETARAIKQKIGSKKLFAVLATPNAMRSKWVPWEIGVADLSKGEGQVLVIPVADKDGNYAGNEYMQLYRRIELDTYGVMKVARPEQPLVLAESANQFLKKNVVYG